MRYATLPAIAIAILLCVSFIFIPEQHAASQPVLTRTPGFAFLSTRYSSSGVEALRVWEVEPQEPIPPCATLPEGMVSWWPAENNGNDIIGANNGTPQDEASFASGEVGQAFSFDGRLSNVILPSSALHDPFTALTIDAWVYPQSYGNDLPTHGLYGQTIISNTDTDGFALRVRDGYIQPDFRLTGGNAAPVFYQTKLPLNTWSHVAATYDGSTIRVYLNGVEQGTGVAASGTIKNIENASNCAMIGNDPDSCAASNLSGAPAGYGWDGRIDELEVFSRALSAEEITAIAGAGSAGKCHTSTIQFSSATYNVAENVAGGNATINVTRTGAQDTSASFHYATSAGSASNGSDYDDVSGDLTFDPGQATKTFDVPIHDDNVFEGDETVNLQLSEISGTGVSPAAPLSATLTINDNETAPDITINNVSQAEGTGGITNLVFTVSLSTPTQSGVDINYSTADDTAHQPGDYTSTSGTLQIPASGSSGTITVPVVADNMLEPDETFLVNLTSTTVGTITDNQGVGTIANDDAPPSISIDDLSETEGNSGTKNFTFNVSLSNPSYQTITVDYATADGTAAAASDYTAITGTVTLNPGDTSKPITVSVNGDTTGEFDETFFINLSGPTNATIADSQGQGTILNDDNRAPTDLTLSGSSIAENSASGSAVGNLSTTDADVGDTHTYSLVTGTGSTDNASFTITGNQLQTAAVFDYETKTSYSIRVRTTDSSAATFDKVFTVTVTNVNEAPTISDITDQSTTANTPTAVIAFTLSDVDTNVNSLTLSGSSSNKTLVPDTNIVFGGSGANRTVMVTPVGVIVNQLHVLRFTVRRQPHHFVFA